MSEEQSHSSSRDHHRDGKDRNHSSRHGDDRHHHRSSSHRHGSSHGSSHRRHHESSHSHRSDRHRSSRDYRDKEKEHRYRSHRHRDDYRERDDRPIKDTKDFNDEYELVEPKHTDNEPITQTHLNELNAKILKAKLRKSSDLPELESEYENLKTKFYQQHNKGKSIKQQNDILNLQKNYTSITNPDDMTIEDMIREEKTTTGLRKSDIQNIIKDKKFSTDLDYQDDQSDSLAKHIQKGSIDLKNIETSQAKNLAKILDRCQLCIENDNCCDILSMSDKVYLTLTPNPSITKFSTMIIPINHVQNTINCDEDEWDEIRNYMISLSKFYYTKLNKSVIFYESSIKKHNHAAIIAVPIPLSLSSTIEGFFKQAIIENSSELEQQHKSIINTNKNSETMGRDAFRYSIAKEAPFFHVWFNLNGGIGHIVEDVYNWPRGDLFAREVIGGVLGVDPWIIKKQGYWIKNDERISEMSEIFKDFDWTEGN
ncbi:Pre-mRNA-splicing factor [Wickerhamomyces ciferrii]|uniref:Pre-mRNA-splicing factor n=1 Tax=Wickerhamomyces ciferrii (strain ATCC 14091 / BCRC 22168 / CBS 111 / JCM 3599 / NBRC 0793 / NRRL Y-1031 F-60-10) TaxID=1206466 RepID=K0KB35_WICCF|nr:Pre-mRNA-splicing factor [Wickerhamomyces ciferrii]CCH42210.1 Pre-mRNA-splicing factor [Wickerhamomyces ciferrii]